jgi:hypothetical protein
MHNYQLTTKTPYTEKEANRSQFAYVSFADVFDAKGEKWEMDDRGLWYQTNQMERPERLSEPFAIRSLSVDDGLWIRFTTPTGVSHEFRSLPSDMSPTRAKAILRGFGMDLSPKRSAAEWMHKYLSAVDRCLWTHTMFDPVE